MIQCQKRPIPQHIIDVLWESRLNPDVSHVHSASLTRFASVSKHRMPLMHDRLPNFLRLFLPIAILMLAGVLLYGQSEIERELTKLRSQQTLSVSLGAGTLNGHLHHIARDLAFWVSDSSLRRAVAKPTPDNLERLGENLVNFSHSQGVYDQLRWLDETGMEVIRVDYTRGQPRVIPDAELQNKGDRYYFQATWKLNAGQVYISPLDLNIEKNQIELPYKPMLRVGTPIFDATGKKRGILIFNYFGNALLDAFTTATANNANHAMLVNSEGYWLKSPDHGDEWGFMFKRPELTLSSRAPQAWAKMRDTDQGQLALADGLWSWQSIYSVDVPHSSITDTAAVSAPSHAELQTPQYVWKSVSHLPAAKLDSVVQAVWLKLSGVTLVLLSLFGFVTWKLAHTWAEQALTTDELRRINDELDQLVLKRTQALSIANVDLSDQKTLLKQILDTSSVAIFLLDSQGRIIQANQRMAEMFGRDMDALVGSEYVALIHPAQREVGHQNMLALFASATQALDLDRLYWHADQSEFWGHLTCRIFYDSVRCDKVLVCVIADITVRKQTEVALRESEERYRTAFLTSPDSVNITRLSDGLCLEVNDGFLRLFGWTREETEGRTSLDMKIWRDPGDRLRLIDALNRDGHCENLEAEFVARDGRVISGLISAHVLTLKGERCVLSVTRDITERKVFENQLRKLSQAVEQSRDSIVITNLDAAIEYVNEAFIRNTGFSREECLGQNPRMLQSGETPRETYVAMWDAMIHGRPWSGELYNQRKDGSRYVEWAVISPIRQPDGNITHYVAVKSDITSKKAADDQINNLAFYDPLTSLPNRRLLLDRLKHAIASSIRNERYGALVLIDLDDFKTLNDTRGHDIGDLLLQQTAQRLLTCLREGDTVARLGGDEFVVLLENLSENAQEAGTCAEMVGGKILLALNQNYQLADYFCHSSASIGVTLFANHQGSIDELLKRADLAMYRAKTAGRNTLRFFEPEMQTAVTKRAALEAGLREAILHDQLVLFYQAQVDGGGAVTGVEALLRWQHPHFGMVSPAEFIPLSEETGLILPIGQWVLETACVQLTRWAGQLPTAHLTIAVNVSARQFHEDDFVERVLDTLERTGANPHRLKLELTEGLLVSNVEVVIAKMIALKEKGLGFSLDDFGTGYSSLSYLKRLPLNQLKIDQGFVRDILVDPNDAAIAKMVIALANTMGLQVIAEGVEFEAQRDFLSNLGCHDYQGYLFSPPVPIEEFEALRCGLDAHSVTRRTPTQSSRMTSNLQ